MKDFIFNLFKGFFLEQIAKEHKISPSAKSPVPVHEEVFSIQRIQHQIDKKRMREKATDAEHFALMMQNEEAIVQQNIANNALKFVKKTLRDGNVIFELRVLAPRN